MVDNIITPVCCNMINIYKTLHLNILQALLLIHIFWYLM